MRKIILITLSILFASLFLQARQVEKNNTQTTKSAYVAGYVSFINGTNEALEFELQDVKGSCQYYQIPAGGSIHGIGISQGIYDVHIHPQSGKSYTYTIEDGYGVLDTFYREGLCYTIEQGYEYNSFYFSVNN